MQSFHAHSAASEAPRRRPVSEVRMPVDSNSERERSDAEGRDVWRIRHMAGPVLFGRIAMGIFSRRTERQGSADEFGPPLELDPRGPRAAAERCLAEVTATADASEDPRARFELLFFTAAARCAGGDVAAALDGIRCAIRAALQADSSGSLAVEVAKMSVEHLQLDEARGGLRVIVDELALSLSGDEDSELRAELAPLAAALGNVRGAIALASAISEPYFADHARAQIVAALCDSGELDSADEILATIETPDARGLAQVALVRARAKTRVDSELEVFADTICDERWREEARFEIATAKAAHGDLDGARASAREIETDTMRGRAMAEIAFSQAELGQSDRAPNWTESIDQPYERDLVWSWLCELHADRGEVDAAEEALAHIEHPRLRESTAVGLARIGAHWARPAESERVLTRALGVIDSLNLAGDHVMEKVELLALAGKVVDALDCIERAPSEERIDLFNCLGATLAVRGDATQVDVARMRRSDPMERALLLAGAARSLLAFAVFKSQQG